MTKSKVSLEQEIKKLINKPVTKKDISECFAELRERGAIVNNFNSYYKRINLKIKGTPDFEIIYKDFLFKIECKISDSDTLSQEQIDYGFSIHNLDNYRVYYFIEYGLTFREIKEAILKEDTNTLSTLRMYSYNSLQTEKSNLQNLILKRSKK